MSATYLTGTINGSIVFLFTVDMKISSLWFTHQFVEIIYIYIYIYIQWYMYKNNVKIKIKLLNKFIALSVICYIFKNDVSHWHPRLG